MTQSTTAQATADPQTAIQLRQMQIYQAMLTGEKSAIPLPVAELETAAAKMLKPEAFDYVAGGAGGERTMRANLEAFDHWRIVPRMLRDVSQRDLSVEIFGSRLPAPVILGPVGVQELVHADADLASARAAASLGIPFTLSTVSSRTIEDVAKAMGDGVRWFQLYWGKDREVTASMVQRAEKSGYSAVVVTLDTVMLGWRERDLKRNFLPFLQAKGIANYVSDPVFRSKLQQPPETHPEGAVRLWAQIFANNALTWDDIAWLRQQTKLPILLKGIQHADDARRTLDAGVQGVIVSNHGGRQVDGAIGSLDALPQVVAAVGAKIPVLFDSGIRYGSDALKALALGARAVLLGRLYIYGLAVAGEQGVREAVINFLADMDVTMGLCGIKACREIGPELLTKVI
jgi:isopentenyl diphosphate isomerase/L-lactate dehydrogenase-like FMN-dependent dehydrogenase